MPQHDAYARRTPFELAFPDSSAFDALREEIREEAETHGVDLRDREAFSMLSAAGAFVHELQGPDAPAEAIQDYLDLVYHAFHFAEAGYPLRLVGADALRYLVNTVPDGSPEPPGQAGYVQLPRNLVWVEGGEGMAAEPVDGLFWTLTAKGRLHVLLVTGIREGRPGLAVVALPGVPASEAATWLDAAVRADGADFANTLPGGEMEGLLAFTAAGEVLKLLARLFAYERAVPDAVEKRAPAGRGDGHGPADEAGEPAASRLPYRRIGRNG